jgi:hypothetical protein
MTTEQQVRDILAAAGLPELAENGRRGADWQVTRSGWHVFTFESRVRVDWWSEGTLGVDPASWQSDRDNLARVRAVLEAAGLAVTAPDSSALELVPEGGA